MNNVTIIMPVSRPDYLNRIFSQLEMLDCDREKTNILLYVDGNHQLYTKARNLTAKSKFKERLCSFRSKGTPSVGSVKRRRQRIADIHNEIKEFIKGNGSDYVFLIEDDTLFPIGTLKQLLKDYSNKPYAGIISAIELGRWGYRHIGAWDCDDVYSPNVITSPKLSDGLQEVDATGFYCCLIKAETYIGHFFEPFEESMGPDVNFGLDLRKQGLTNYVNHDIKCTHLTKKGGIKFSNSEVIQVELRRTDAEKFGWKTRQL